MKATSSIKLQDLDRRIKNTQLETLKDINMLSKIKKILHLAKFMPWSVLLSEYTRGSTALA
jgi:hypothetical protein